GRPTRSSGSSGGGSSSSSQVSVHRYRRSPRGEGHPFIDHLLAAVCSSGRCGHQLLSRPWQSSGRIGRAVSARSRRIRVQRLGTDTTPSGIREGGILPPSSVHRGLLSDKTDRRPPRSSAHALHTQGFSMPLFPRNSVHHTRLRLPCHPAHRSTTLGEHMPRLSHIFDITPVEREVVFETVDAAYAVARSCRFDGRGWLLLPDEGTRELLYSRAEELGIIDPETAGR